MKRTIFFAAIAVVASAFFFLCSCERGLDIQSDSDYSDSVPLEHGMIELGEKLENPYKVANITEALNNLYPGSKAASFISPTHYYVRFLPKNEEEYNRLQKLGLELLDHPLDYKIVKEGDYYHDPSIPQGEFTWLYASVPKFKILPIDIHKELLDDCYLPDPDLVVKGAEQVDWDAVEREAYRISGNAAMIPSLKSGTKGGSVPRGRIFVHDDTLGEDVGVAGVTVSCNIFIKFASAVTDKDGYYTMNKEFSGNPRYRLVFKNEKGFALGFNLIIIPGSISTLGKGSPEGMDCFVNNESDKLLFARCVVNNAAYDYFNACSASSSIISCPPSNLRIWIMTGMGCSSTLMLQHGALVDGSILEKFLGEYMWILKMFLPDVTVGLAGREGYAQIYSSTIHQCAHASHYMRVGNDYWNRYLNHILRSFISTGTTYGSGTEDDRGPCEISEMWANYLETVTWNDRYPSQKCQYGLGYWFYPQIFTALDEKGINRYKIFETLTSDIDNRNILQAKLLSLYPECKSIINQAFNAYK